WPPPARSTPRRSPARSWSESSQRLRRHLALASVREQARRLVERQPARLRHLDADRLLDLPDPAPAGPQEVEADDLEDPHPARAGVGVLHVAELLDQAALDPGLLADLPERGLVGLLARVEIPLRQGPDALPLAPGQ